MSTSDRWWRAGILGVGLAALLTNLWWAVASARAPFGWDPFVVSPFISAPLWWVTGWIAWQRRPSSRIGLLMVLTGTLVALGKLYSVDLPAGYTVAWLLDGLHVAVIAHMLLTFPGGRIRTSGERLFVCLIYTTTIVANVVQGMFDDPRVRGDLPRNLLLITHSPDVVLAIDVVTAVASIGLAVAFVVVLRARWRVATVAGRRVLGPVYTVAAAGGLVMVATNVAYVTGIQDSAVLVWHTVEIVVLTLVPVAFLVGILRTRMGRAEVGDLVVALGSDANGELAVRDELARRLGDPTLDVVYLVDGDTWVDSEGVAVDLAAVEQDGARSVVRLRVGGEEFGAVLHDPALEEEPELVEGAIAAARLALLNDRLRTDLSRQLVEVTQSRRRIVEAGDEARRRVERDLHDGAQQRLVGVSLALRMLEDSTDDQELAGEVEALRLELATAVAELRDLARGLHPAVLNDAGLAAAIDSLAERSPVPVRCGCRLDDVQVPADVETTAYFVVSEALANVAKHAQGASACVEITVVDGDLVVAVSDDGPGGADAGAGSGLAGLGDRVAAIGGTISVVSPPGQGTSVVARVPVGSGRKDVAGGSAS